MIKTLSGIILLALPFLILVLFKDKKRGFIYVLFSSLLFHTGLAFLTQFFGIFYYSVIVVTTAFADLILFLLFARQTKFFLRGEPLYGAPSPRKKLFGPLFKIDWALVLAVVIAFLSLLQVHYNYTGKINFTTDTEVSYHEVQNMTYPYPYFSDEWYAVLLIENSIESGGLPLEGFAREPFANLEMFFHSFTAEIMLILGLDPLTQYTLLSIFANILIAVLAYIFLRLSGVSRYSAGFSCLFILYIVSGANLPGIWNFIPVNAGIIFCLVGFCFLSMNNFKMALLASLPIILFYAPVFIFYGAGLAVFAILRLRVRLVFLAAGFFALFAVFSVFLARFLWPGFIDFVFSKVFYTCFYGAGMNVELPFYFIIPLPAVFLAFFGLHNLYNRNKWLLSVLLLGAAFWIFYSFTTSRFLIEYERAVFFTSIIVCLVSGIGLYEIEKLAGNLKKAFKCLVFSGIVLLAASVPFYTQGENWKNFIVRDIEGGSAVYYPKAPANQYLMQDDLEIFENIENKRFLSIPWKGTVIGVATRNMPLAIKEGTISLPSNIFHEFLAADCSGKQKIAKQQKIDYIYLPEFNCPEFKEINKSKEEFYLYEVTEQ